MVCPGALASPFKEPGVDVPLMLQILPKKSWLIPVLEKTDVQQTNLISIVTKGQTPVISLQAEARVSPAAGKLGSWELCLAGVSGWYYRGVFLHVRERKERANSRGLTLETFRSGVPVMPERSAWSVNTSTIPILLRVFIIS